MATDRVWLLPLSFIRTCTITSQNLLFRSTDGGGDRCSTHTRNPWTPSVVRLVKAFDIRSTISWRSNGLASNVEQDHKCEVRGNEREIQITIQVHESIRRPYSSDATPWISATWPSLLLGISSRKAEDQRTGSAQRPVLIVLGEIKSRCTN